MQLRQHQKDALRYMKNGCILCGGVGSGKSITSLSYYYLQMGGSTQFLDGGDYIPMDDVEIKDLYIITTARKRDTLEWESEMIPFLLTSNDNLYHNKVIVDSWNNIKKYSDVSDAFFIFDEQRVVGYGAWTKAFLKIAKKNQWILLSATPGDRWHDYLPVFIANGFFKNKREFEDEHVKFDRYAKFPKVDRYLNTKRLSRMREAILVDMDFQRPTESHHIDIWAEFEPMKYKDIFRKRWNPYTDEPITSASELCYVLRQVINSHESRQVKVLEICEDHPKVIIFYNFDYELEILRNIAYIEGTEVAEWNGHNHQPIPDSDRWVYLVQYTAGAEGWNCTSTDTIIFYSQNYSYKVMVQSSGRIDRMNTPFKDLYYYHIKSRAGIDISIGKALKEKKKFNERKFVNWKGE